MCRSREEFVKRLMIIGAKGVTEKMAQAQRQQQVVERFIEALKRLENDRDVETMAALYAVDGEIGNVVAPDKFHGPDGAREFWTKYRETFGEVSSSFRNRLIADGGAALEWTTTGTTAGGTPFKYDGVSILEFDGDHITRFQAYFNAEDLSRQIVEATQPAAQKAAGVDQ